MKFTLIAFTIITAVFNSFDSIADESIAHKIGVINSNSITLACEAFKAFDKNRNEQFKKYEEVDTKEKEALQASAEKMAKEVNDSGGDTEVINSVEQRYAKAQYEFAYIAEQRQLAIQDAVEKAEKEQAKALFKVLGDIKKEKNLTLILDASAVPLYDAGYDYTKIALEKLNKELPKTISQIPSVDEVTKKIKASMKEPTKVADKTPVKSGAIKTVADTNSKTKVESIDQKSKS